MKSWQMFVSALTKTAQTENMTLKVSADMREGTNSENHPDDSFRLC